MRFNKKLLQISYFIITLFMLGMTVSAQTTTATTPTVTSSNNQVATLMIIIAIVLAFVIWGMGQVLFSMGKLILQKGKHTDKILPVIMMMGFSLIGLVTQAQTAPNTAAVTELPNYGGLSSTTFWMLFSVILTEMIVIFFMMFSISRFQQELIVKKVDVKGGPLKNWWSNLDKKLFTKAVPVEKEADVMLDHNYDGIRELDNALPPWWKYGFIITVVVAFVYLLNFHVMGYGKNPTQEYEAEMTKAKSDMELYASKVADKVDESNITMADAAGLAAAKDIYNSTCWTCHGKLGEGGAGPNLTDDYWIHKGSLNDIYLSIKHGYPDKGMQAWEKNYSPKEISNLAGYIKTMRGTNPPNGKAAQGDLFEETVTKDSAVAPIKAGKDSLVTIIKDTVTAVKK
ncbi:MAG TPA: cbb3-type cytochrome c oxidase N-terminal domain-containing protein [Ferruginibacter sp.]|nr:cbb3-type cytochrome c oxidase N-terminal domain-containing protein [Ferruginibacter sp.]